jgi:uncharacterized membrane protein YoaK (UPF0700 family)
MRRLRGVLVSLVLGATAGGLLLVRAHLYAAVVPLIAAVIVVIIAKVFFREPDKGMK